MDTLTAEGPYAYTIVPEVHPDGTVKLPILSTADEIREIYTLIRGISDLKSVEPIVELRGSWYSFHEAISRGQIKNTDLPPSEHVTLGLFPVSTGKGITGELVWIVRPRAELGSAVNPEDGDVGALMDCLNDGVASAVRDYVHDTGKLASLHGKDEHRAYYESFFAKYSVESIDLLDRVVQDSYAFAELRYTVAARDGSGSVSFHTAEFHMPAGDGRFIARIGHGTDPR
jgi:hypothetical protein